MPHTKKSRRQWGQRFGDNSQKTTDDSILPIEDNTESADDHDTEWAAFLDTLDNAKGIDQQTEKVAEGIRRLYPYEGRKEQVEAIRALIYDREDLILIAKTSFGKSMIPQAVSALRRNTITIMIIPLTALGEEQYHKMERLPGCKPCLLTAKTITKMVMRKIRNSEYTHILLSPELANSPEFSNVATDPIFKSRVGLVVVDELHVVKQWGREFRKQYGRLSSLRRKLGTGIPWFGTTATLPDATLEAVKKSVAFKEDVRVIRTSVDRPEISLIIQPIEKNKAKTFEGLYFVLDKVINDSSETGDRHALSDIPKTIIYFESKAVINNALACIRGWLVQLGYDIKAVSLATKSYHSTTADKDKELVMLEFQKEGQQSVHRILLATDSLGMGVDLPDISQVVQWKVPKQ